jgi:hypothetical protein
MPDEVDVEVGLLDPVFRAQFKKEIGKEVEEDLGRAAMT